MQLKPYLGLVLTVFLAFAAGNARSQSSPAATEAKLPLAVGLGLSGFNSNWNSDRLVGGTLSINYSLNMLPHSLQGLGLEPLAAISTSTAPRRSRRICARMWAAAASTTVGANIAASALTPNLKWALATWTI